MLKRNKINFQSELEDKSFLFKKNKKDLYKIFYEVTKELNVNKKVKFVVSLNIFNSETIRQYNLEYRQKDSTTDVLSFPHNEEFNNTYDLGDILINGEILEEQAKSIESNENMELKFLFLHGLLHLIGYDHMNLEDEKKMINRQKEILNITKIRNEKMI